jgi:ribonuclease HI
MKHLKLFTDGASRGNPGESAASYFLFDKEETLIDFGGILLGLNTNNVAEYTGLIMGLKAARKHMIQNITCYLDSELIVKQLNGIYKVNDMKMKKLFEEVQILKNKFDTITFNHIPREKNKHADKLVNLLLDTLK